MFRKDLVFAIRNLRRNLLISTINVLGLSIGITACLVIFLIVNYEFSFDTFQPDRDRIYRVYTQFSGHYIHASRGVPTAFANVLRDESTGIEAVADFHTLSTNVKVPDTNGARKDFDTNYKIIIAGSSYFQCFSYYEWLEGTPDKSLNEPHRVVLTASRAKIYFGDIPFNEMIGREIHYQDSLKVTVSGIVKDIEHRTDFDFTDFISFSTIQQSWLKNNILLDNWTNNNSTSQLFIKAAPGTSRANLEGLMPKVAAPLAELISGSDFKMTPTLQPLADIHFNTAVGIFDHSRSVTEKSTLKVLSGIALLLLLIGAINFINLETAQASRRAREVGVRKVLGSSRRKLIAQFLTESFILTLCAVLLSVVLASNVFYLFDDVIPAGLVFDLSEKIVWLFFASCLVVVTMLAGVYPAFVLSSYQPAAALKNLVSSSTGGSRSSTIRKGLTVFQFSFSQVLIIASLAIGWQINYMLNKDLGFNTEAIIHFNVAWWHHPHKRDLLKNELSQIPEIETISLNSGPPSLNTSPVQQVRFDNGRQKFEFYVHQKSGDADYLRLYNIKLLAGRNLQQSDTTTGYLVNETYMKQVGITSPHDLLGRELWGKPIVGVVQDFHNRSLHTAIDPVIVVNEGKYHGSFGVKLRTQNNKVSDLKPAIAKIETAWNKIYPDQKFTYTFMDDAIKRFYEVEQRTGKLAKAATIIAVLISCLGLFGL
jgi:putative ABC transport system permease protein